MGPEHELEDLAECLTEEQVIFLKDLLNSVAAA